MVDTYILKKSNRKNKKYVIIMGKIKINFGDDRYEDYTIHKNIDRKNRYILRTKKQPQNDINSPAFWSLNLLWNKPTLKNSIKDVEEKFNIKILNKT